MTGSTTILIGPDDPKLVMEVLITVTAMEMVLMMTIVIMMYMNVGAALKALVI